MATFTVQFSVKIKDVEITQFDYSIKGIGSYYGVVATGSSINGSVFSASLRDDEAAYFSVTVLVKSYRVGGVSHTVTEQPISLFETFTVAAFHKVVEICPESSIASIYTFARMATVGDDGWVDMTGNVRNMKIAYGMKQHLYETGTGIGEMIRTSPNRFETNSYPMFNSLCNLFYYCAANPTVDTETGSKPFYSTFLDYAWHKEDAPNQNFLQAVRNMLHDPFHKADKIYGLIESLPEIYVHSLSTMDVAADSKAPNQWTLTLKTNKSGSKNFIPSGTAFVVFDANDYAWVANNFRAGGRESGTHCLVYKYDATPAPFSPVQGGGLLGVGFGAAVSPDKKKIAFGNFGWGSVYNNPQEGSISRFNYNDGTPISPSNGNTPGLSRVQGMNYDEAGHLWMASVGYQEPFAPAPLGVYAFESAPSAVVVYLYGEPTAENMLVCNKFPIKRAYELDPTEPVHTPDLKVFDVVPDNKGNAYVSCIGNYDKNPEKCALSAVYKVSIEGKELKVVASWYSDYPNKANGHKGYESLRQIAINGDGDVVVVGVASSRATVLDKDNLGFKGYYATNTHAPWGIKIDQKGTVFLANFGHETDYANEKSLDMQGPFGVTMLRDASQPETAKLLTVPTGGAEVMLDNGMPLYGSQKKPIIVDGKPEKGTDLIPCYQPIMRLTSTNIDGAGNLWCLNNWKPSAIVDVAENPGGDGVVIFLGIAEPE